MSMRDDWRPIPGYEGLYSASSDGRVRSEPRTVERNGRSMALRGRTLRQSLAQGRPMVSLSREGVVVKHLVHRLVLLAHVGPPLPGQECCHGNGDRADNRLENLRWDDHAENLRDQVRHGTHAEASKTHCQNGHLFDEENTYQRKTQRACRTCGRAYVAAYRARRLAARLA